MHPTLGTRPRSARVRSCTIVLGLMALCTGKAFAAEHENAALARAAQNPIADMISLPFQNNINLNAGPLKKTQNILNIQPVFPISLGPEWNLITRTIVPVISQPAFTPTQDRDNGIGDIQFSAFLSPKKPVGGWIVGFGAIAQGDTATDDRLGQGVWGLGPTAVALQITKEWVYGALINNVWSVSKHDNRSNVNQMLLQPFVNYNFPHSPGRYLTTAPIITADWEAASGQKWTVPLGLGIGQITRWGHQPVNLQASAYYNVERPDHAPNWQLRLQIQFLFPK